MLSVMNMRFNEDLIVLPLHITFPLTPPLLLPLPPAYRHAYSFVGALFSCCRSRNQSERVKRETWVRVQCNHQIQTINSLIFMLSVCHSTLCTHIHLYSYTPVDLGAHRSWKYVHALACWWLDSYCNDCKRYVYSLAKKWNELNWFIK